LPTKSDDPELLNLLVAYPYMTADMIRLLKDNQSEVRFLLDSGAFTAWKAGKSIKVDDYCRFIESLPFKPWRYFTLDVIGDPAGSLKNYEVMLKRGFKPVPIFTRGEDVSVLEDYYKTSDVVGIGGLVGTRGNKGFVNGIMQKVGTRKVHWLGFTRVDYMKFYKPYMCDSSSWASGQQYGVVSLYDKAGKFVKITRASVTSKPNLEIIKLCKAHGIEPERLTKRSEWRNTAKGLTALEQITYRAFVRLQADVYKKLETLLFLAVCNTHQGNLFLEATHFWKTKKEVVR
jgi:hypothetical protein